jgi:hypothetical protein
MTCTTSTHLVCGQRAQLAVRIVTIGFKGLDLIESTRIIVVTSTMSTATIINTTAIVITQLSPPSSK